MFANAFHIFKKANYILKYAEPIISIEKIQSCRYPGAINLTRCQKMCSLPDDVLKEKERNLGYSELLEKKKDKNTVLIDVREHLEIQETGKLPDSIHIPLNELLNALQNLSPEEFYKKYNAKKPSLDQSLIFSCRSGRRSEQALKIALKLGYKDDMSLEEFKKKYSVDRPSKDKHLIFSCKAGNRSQKALAQAYALGYANSAHYKGGWLDWEKNTKKQ